MSKATATGWGGELDLRALYGLHCPAPNIHSRLLPFSWVSPEEGPGIRSGHSSHLLSVPRGAEEQALTLGGQTLGGAVAAAGYYGDREARAQGSPEAAEGN